MAAESAIRYIELLNELAATMAASLVEDGFPPGKARAAAERAAEHVQAEFGGGPAIYIPKGLGYLVARRNAEIRRRLAAGEAPVAVARAFNLSYNHVIRIQGDHSPSRGPRDAPPGP